MQCLLRTSFPFPRGGEGEKGNSESRSKEHWILTREILMVNKTLTSESERNLLNIMRLDETARRGKAPHCNEKKKIIIRMMYSFVVDRVLLSSAKDVFSSFSFYQ